MRVYPKQGLRSHLVSLVDRISTGGEVVKHSLLRRDECRVDLLAKHMAEVRRRQARHPLAEGAAQRLVSPRLSPC